VEALEHGDLLRTQRVAAREPPREKGGYARGRVGRKDGRLGVRDAHAFGALGGGGRGRGRAGDKGRELARDARRNR